MSILDTPLEGKFILSTQQDITARISAERRIAYLALHDPLTELPNRAAFAQELATVMEEAEARSEEFAVPAVDLGPANRADRPTAPGRRCRAAAVRPARA